MLRAERGNVVLDIKDEDADFYAGRGYTIFDGADVIKKATPSTVADYKRLLAASEARIVKLEAEIASLSAPKQKRSKK